MATATLAAPRTHHFKLPIRTEATLREFIRAAYGVTIPDTQVCPTHSTPWRAFADAYFARSPVAVWKASRGFGGKSFLLSLLALVEAQTLAAEVSVLGGSGEQSKRVLDHMGGFWRAPHAPRGMLQGEVATRMRLTNGAIINALTASSKSVRGLHPQRLRIDEADECDMQILDAAFGMPMSRGDVQAQTVLSSTHHYPDGSMTELLRRAAAASWPVHEWCVFETREANGGWLPEAQIALTKALMSQAMWENEILLQEPSPESRAIMPASVAAMFKRELGVFAGEPRQYVEIEKPVGDGIYFHGADWAKSQDWTIIKTFRQVTPKLARLVAFERLGREPYPAMVARFDQRVQRYGGAAAYDRTGLGTVVEDLITVPAKGIMMIGRDRADMISEYIAAIERGEIESPFIAHDEAEHRLASRAIFQAGDEHLPDGIAAGALAWWHKSHHAVPSLPPRRKAS